MRVLLDKLYTVSAYAAACCMVLLAIMVLAGIVSRLAGFNLPGIDAYAGYLMAGAGFLALAQTFNKGEHIRVTLLVQKASPAVSRALALWSLFAASVLAGLFAAYSVRLAWQSHSFKDISTGNDATPLWLPQLLMAAGAVVFFIAVTDALLACMQGKPNVASTGSNDLLKSE